MSTASRTFSDSRLLVPPVPVSPLASRGHTVQFYEEDTSFLDSLSHFIGAAIVAGDSAVVVATRAHHEGLAAHLKERGLDPSLAIRQGRLFLLDAHETLSTITVDGQPDPALFAQVIGRFISQLVAEASAKDRRVVAFGEMVALLWEDGRRDAALRLEQLWNQFSESNSFYLHCAYPMRLFTQESDGHPIMDICAEHTHVIPSERYSPTSTDQQRLHSVVLLQQKAQALETEMRERSKAQRALQEREAELQDFLENAVIGMHWVAADGTILWANKAELAITGYAPEEYIGHHISEFHADPSVTEGILERLGRQEELHDHEARIRCKDGSIRHVRIDSNVFSRDGRFVHTRCFTTDITDRKLADQAQFRLAAIVESSDDAIVSKDLNGIVTSWNAGAQRIFGYTPEEIVGRPITILIPAELRNDETLILSKITAGERIDHFKTVRVTKSGERIHVSLTVSPVRDQHGKIIGAAKIARDITHQKKLEDALHTTEKLASVGRLAATVAHEINNPLESVMNFVYLARQQADISEESRRYLAAADQELARVAHIAQQTLGFYRDTSRPVTVSISDVIENVLSIYDSKFRYKSLQVERRIDPGITLCVMQGELKQVLSNLIVNATDASSHGGRLIIAARSSQHHPSGRSGVRITIADTGAGIAKKDLEKLFVPFFSTKKAVGTGLGLWITKDLLEKKGGSIAVRSTDASPSGTVFHIFLPDELPTHATELRCST